jgi:hypothetical protein
MNRPLNQPKTHQGKHITQKQQIKHPNCYYFLTFSPMEQTTQLTDSETGKRILLDDPINSTPDYPMTYATDESLSTQEFLTNLIHKIKLKNEKKYTKPNKTRQ